MWHVTEVARGAEYHNVSLYIGLCAAVVVIVIVVIAIIIVLKRKTARSHDSAFDVEISQGASFYATSILYTFVYVVPHLALQC